MPRCDEKSNEDVYESFVMSARARGLDCGWYTAMLWRCNENELGFLNEESI